MSNHPNRSRGRFRVGEQEFPSKKIAMEHFKLMLSRYRAGAMIYPDDALGLSALLATHPEAAEKVGTGIASFSVRMTSHGTKCFCLRRIDGTETDFSYIACFNPPSIKAQACGALRHAVAGDIVEARNAYFDFYKLTHVHCAETADVIRRSEADLDHRHPMTFNHLVACFMVGRGQDYAALLAPNRDNQERCELASAEVAEAFREFHREHAQLDFVQASVNRSQVRTVRTNPPHIVLREWIST